MVDTLLNTSTTEFLVSTINFSVPDDVKKAFNTAFEGQNKSAVMTELMREAVERVEARKRGQVAFLRIVKRRRSAPQVTQAQVRKAREEGRPLSWTFQSIRTRALRLT
jgi:hypothetical protein